MKDMKRNTLLIPFVAVLAMFAVSMASAALADDVYTRFNDVSLKLWSVDMAANPGEIVPVKVTFTAAKDADDVRVKVYMEGHRDDVSVKTNRFDIVGGKTYTKLLSLEMPSDSDESSEDYMLYVRIYTEDESKEVNYPISVQKESYTFEVKSVDCASEVSAGDVLDVAVLVKNTAYHRMDDTRVVVSIPALGVSALSYAGDLVTTAGDEDNEDKEDSAYQTVSLRIPEKAASGVYELEIEVYNDDASTIVEKFVAFEGEVSKDVIAVENQDVNDGTVSSSVVALTVILVIVFVVLLAVLVVLLTKKEKPIEEVETSYY